MKLPGSCLIKQLPLDYIAKTAIVAALPTAAVMCVFLLGIHFFLNAMADARPMSWLKGDMRLIA